MSVEWESNHKNKGQGAMMGSNSSSNLRSVPWRLFLYFSRPREFADLGATIPQRASKRDVREDNLNTRPVNKSTSIWGAP